MSSDKGSSDTKDDRETVNIELKIKNMKAANSSLKTQLIDPKPLPNRIQKAVGKKHVNNYTESERKRRQAKKLEYANQVGWIERKGRHRHAHQAKREQELINYMNGLPPDYGVSDGSD